MEGVSKWKQSKQITGVSLSSLVDFKATIAEEKQEILSGRPNQVRIVDETPKNKGGELILEFLQPLEFFSSCFEINFV